MSWRLFSFGIALAACLHAYYNPESSIFPRTAGEAQLRLRDFWHRTWFMTQGSPYILSEQSHIVQHPPPEDALTPVQRKALEKEQEKLKKLGKAASAGDSVTTQPVARMPAYFISYGSPDTILQPETLPYKSLQALGNEIVACAPKAIVVVSPHWIGETYKVFINDGSENPIDYDFSGATDEHRKHSLQSKADPMLADRLIKLYGESKPKVRAFGQKRALDFGVWQPFSIMFNGTTSIPIIQVSQYAEGGPEEALKLGRAIQDLRDEGVMFIGVGMAAYNPKLVHKYSIDNPAPWVEQYLEVLRVMVEDYSGLRRTLRSKQMTYNTSFRNVHPTADYIMPLLFVVGASGEDEGEVLFSMEDGPMAWAHYRFSSPQQVM